MTSLIQQTKNKDQNNIPRTTFSVPAKNLLRLA